MPPQQFARQPRKYSGARAGRTNRLGITHGNAGPGETREQNKRKGKNKEKERKREREEHQQYWHWQKRSRTADSYGNKRNCTPNLGQRIGWLGRSTREDKITTESNLFGLNKKWKMYTNGLSETTTKELG